MLSAKEDTTSSASESNELAFLQDFVFRVQNCAALPTNVDDEIIRLCAAAALLMIFIQANWTVTKSRNLECTKLFALAPTPGLEGAPFGLKLDGDRMRDAGLRLLCADGEAPSINTRVAHCLIFARAILCTSKSAAFVHLSHAQAWWVARVATLNQLLLDECPSQTLDSMAITNYRIVLDSVAGAGASCGPAFDGRDVETVANLELAVYAYRTQQRALYRETVKAAKKCSQLQWKLDGALGVRTRFQTEKRAQLIVRHLSGRVAVDVSTALFSGGIAEDNGLPQDVPLDDDTLLPEVRLDEDCMGAQASMLDQALILLEGMALKILEANDEALRNEQLRPFTRFLTAQPRTLWCHSFTALWQRSKIEGGKRRTSIRSLSQLRSLLEQASGDSPTGSIAREANFFGIAVPSAWQLQRDVAMAFCKEGIFDSAAAIFLEIQSWHDVIDCYTAINEVEKAEAIVRTRLQIEPSPRLWCALGELCERSRIGKTPLANDADDAMSCYKHALSIDPKYTHAHRCIAKLAYKEGWFDIVIRHLEIAVSLNALSLPSWYTLGCTCLRTKQWHKARRAFTNYVQAKPDDGEGYANLAVALVRLQLKKEAYVVLSEGVKHSWTNWRVWHNYVSLCIDTGHFSTGIRAINRLVDLKHVDEAIDMIALSVLVRVSQLCVLVCLFTTRE